MACMPQRRPSQLFFFWQETVTKRSWRNWEKFQNSSAMIANNQSTALPLNRCRRQQTYGSTHSTIRPRAVTLPLPVYFPTFSCRHVAFLFSGTLVVKAFANHKHFGLVYVRQNGDWVGIKQHGEGYASKTAFSTIQEPYFHSRIVDMVLLLKISWKGLPAWWIHDSSHYQSKFSWPRNSSNVLRKSSLLEHTSSEIVCLGLASPTLFPVKFYNRYMC